MPRRINYLSDTHVVSGADAALARFMKCWYPAAGVPLVGSLPTYNTEQLWWVYWADLCIVHADGKGLMGGRAAIIDLGPPGLGGLYMAFDYTGPMGGPVMRDPQPVSYGIGYAIWPPLVATDVITFRAKYEVMK